jgi:hypothetical protein
MMKAFTNYYRSWNCKNCMECPRPENPRDVGKDGGGLDPEMVRRKLFGKPWKCCGGVGMAALPKCS